jgi:hydrogenase expression/formation protein HypC
MCLAVPGKIIEITDSDPITRTGKVSFGGIVKDVNLAYVPEAGVDSYVIVHAGFAISTLDEKEADEVFGYLKEIGEIEEMPEF